MDRDTALKEAVQAGLNELDKLERDGVEGLSFDATDSGALVLAVWPVLESFRESKELHEFVDRMKARFPHYEMLPFGGNVFDYIVGNVRNAVLEEATYRLQKLRATMVEAEKSHAFRSVPHRDWRVSIAVIDDCISELRVMEG